MRTVGTFVPGREWSGIMDTKKDDTTILALSRRNKVNFYYKYADIFKTKRKYLV